MTDLKSLADVQLSHSAWSIERVLEACQKLPEPAFAEPFEIGEGSLQAVLAHVLEAMGFFADVFDEKYRPGEPFDWSEPPGFAERTRTASGQMSLLAEYGPSQRRAGLELLQRRGADGFVWWPNAERHVPVSVSIAQVVDHTSYHRAQCNNMLRRVGVEPLDIDLHEWAVAHAVARATPADRTERSE